jgi:hypothetical protein
MQRQWMRTQDKQQQAPLRHNKIRMTATLANEEAAER